MSNLLSMRNFTLMVKKIFIYTSSKSYKETGYDLDLDLLATIL